MENLWPRIQEWLTASGVDLGPKVLAAIAILIIGRVVARFLEKLVRKVMANRQVEQTLISFTAHLTYALLMTFVILAAISKLGIQTTSFIAVLGAAGLAIGLALQGSLANFAAGVLLIIFRPFKVGDYIEGGGTAGTVEEIQIFTTLLKSPDNRKIIVPNAKMTADNITNYSAKDTRRVDMVFGVSYSDDLDKVRRIITGVLEADSRVLKDPAPVIAVATLNESSVDFVARPWVKSADFWAVKFDVTEAIKKKFDAERISIPFPQRDVHLYQHSSG